MNFLLDVNVLIALAFQNHTEHSRVMGWYESLIGSKTDLATCSITEIGFIRVSLHAGYERTAGEASETLLGIKRTSRIPFDLLSDDLGADRLPAFVTGAKQVTDGHLLELANKHDRQLATLDQRIPGAFLIP